MKIYYPALLILFVLTAGLFSPAHSEEKSKSAPVKIEMLDDAVVETLAKSGEASEQDQLLSRLAGTWYYEMQYRDKDGAEPQVSTGIISNEMILGGRYLSTKTSLVLNIGGQNIPYEGWGVLGYDTDKKAFVSVWADSLHSGFVTANGQYNEEKNAIEEKGSFKNPLDEKEQPYRSVIQFADDGTYKRTFFITGKNGKEFKVIEITFERR